MLFFVLFHVLIGKIDPALLKMSNTISNLLLLQFFECVLQRY